MIPAASINMHRVTKVTVGRAVHLFNPTENVDSFRSIIAIETPYGEVELTLFSDDAQALAIREGK